MTVDVGEVCGSWRTTRLYEGMSIESAWCSRVEGPCPFVGTDRREPDDRRCALDPGRVLRVSWSPEAIDAAYARLGRTEQRRQDVDVARDALRACGAGEVSL